MTVETQAEEHFRKAFELIKQMPKTKERDDLLKRALEYCVLLHGYKKGQTVYATITIGEQQ